jgi:hypothetical protein
MKKKFELICYNIQEIHGKKHFVILLYKFLLMWKSVDNVPNKTEKSIAYISPYVSQSVTYEKKK